MIKSYKLFNESIKMSKFDIHNAKVFIQKFCKIYEIFNYSQ